MLKETEHFIKALKHGLTNDDNSKSLRDVAINYLSAWSGTPKEAYNEVNLYSVVLTYFLDYLDTSDTPSVIIRKYLDSQRFRSYLPSEKNKTKVDDMLNALYLTQVKNKDGEYINGFTEI